MKRTLIVSATLSALLLAAVAWGQTPAPAPAAGPGMHEGMGPHGAGMGMGMGRGAMRGMQGRAGMNRGLMGPGMWGQLDLTEAQRDRIADIHDRTMRQNVRTRADLQIARLDLARLMRAERPDARAINAQIDRMAALRASMQKAHVAALLEARGVLTPEQLKKLHELRDRGPGRAGMGFGLDDGEDAPGPGDEGGIEG